MAPKTVHETDVLIATADWLHRNGWSIRIVSPGGPGNKHAREERVRLAFKERGVPFRETSTSVPEIVEGIGFVTRGPDIVAKKDSDRWKTECKGRGTGKPPTLRNNLDRALASAVSYYDQSENLQVGLALPAGDTEMDYLRTRVPSALRRKLNLWVFLYDSKRDAVNAIQPGQDIPDHR
jgi:hypothetical protein